MINLRLKNKAMMKKTIFAALALLAATSAWSQTEQKEDFTDTVEYSTDRYKVETNRFWDNWFITAGGGVHMFFSDHDKQMKFGDRLSPALDVAVGKWFTPSVGVRLMYSGLSLNGATQTGAYSNGKPISGKPWNGYWLEEQHMNFYNIHMDAMVNLVNLFGGYKAKRVYGFSPYFGVGVIGVTSSPKNTEISGHLGVLNTFRLCSALDLNLDIRSTFINDGFDSEVGGRGGETFLTATLGLAYKFNQRNWEKSKTIIRYDNRKVNELQDKLDQLNAENARLQKALAEGQKQEAEAIVKRIASSSLITFQIGKSKLSNEARANIGMIAEAIKASDPKAVYTITGYADAGTGSKALNERLSKKRAEAVYDCLVNEFGVSESQLRIDYKGGVDNMFYDDPRLSRAVIMKSN